MIIPIIEFRYNPIQEIDKLADNGKTEEVLNSMFAYNGRTLLQHGIIPKGSNLEAVGVDVNDLIYNLIDGGNPEDFDDIDYAIVSKLNDSGKLHYEVLNDINYINNLYGLDSLWEDLSSSTMRTIRRVVSEYKNDGDDK